MIDIQTADYVQERLAGIVRRAANFGHDRDDVLDSIQQLFFELEAEKEKTEAAMIADFGPIEILTLVETKEI